MASGYFICLPLAEQRGFQQAISLHLFLKTTSHVPCKILPLKGGAFFIAKRWHVNEPGIFYMLFCF